MQIQKNNILILIIGFLLIIISIVLALFIQLEIIILSLVILVFLILLKYINYSKNILLSQLTVIKEEIDQNEAILNIQNLIQPRLPLPSMTGWAVSPDFINIIIKYILTKKPETIIELGSGVSTVIVSYLIEQYNLNCKFFSLEEDLEYFNKTKQEIRDHKLEKLVVLKYTPLKQYNINNQSYNWYDLKEIELPNIDFLLIDGPSTVSNIEARYPAIPLLFDKINDRAIILLDDANRPGEKMITKEWISQYPELELEFLKTKKGTALLLKNP